MILHIGFFYRFNLEWSWEVLIKGRYCCKLTDDAKIFNKHGVTVFNWAKKREGREHLIS